MTETHEAERWFLLAAVVVAILLVTPETSELFNLGRATAALLLAAGLLGVVATVAVTARRLVLPMSPAVWAAAGVLGALFLAAVVGGFDDAAVLGPYARYNGLLPHLAYAVLFVGVLRQPARQFATQLAWVIVACSGPMIAYGLLQAADIDPVTWTGARARTVFATFGQPNFAAGFTAVVVPFLVWAARRATTVAVRATAGVATIGAVAFVLGTKSFQGPATIAVALAPLLLFELHDRFGLDARRLVTIAAGAFVLAVVAALAVSPLRGNLEDGLEERLLLWETATEMAVDAPLLGQGLGEFGDEFGRFRPVEHATGFGVFWADHPHSVPLRMLSEGGLLLFSAYLAFVVLTGWEAVRALRRRKDLLTVSVVSAWLAYQVQSVVSFDVPPLAIMHWILAGTIVGLARLEEPVESARGRRRQSAAVATRFQPLAVGVGVMVLALLPATRPLRADMAVENANERLAAGQLDAAVDELERATDLAPWEGVYWGHLATVQQAAGVSTQRVLASGERAVDASRGQMQFVLTLAQLAEAVGRGDVAHRWWDTAVERDPQSPSTWLLAGRYSLAHGDAEISVQRLKRANDLLGNRDASTLTYLADAYRVAGEIDEAIEVYEEVLRLRPDDAPATAALDELRASARSEK